MGIGLSLVIVIALTGLVFLGVAGIGLDYLFGVIMPYLAIVTFLAGMVWRVVKWARAPVPFRVPTVHGQQKSLPWIKSDKIGSPSCTAGIVGRMALEILFFRSLFKNTSAELKDGQRLVYHWEKWLWLAGLVFHWAFLIVVLRHLRFFSEPTPFFVSLLGNIDGFLQVGLQPVYISGVAVLVAVTYLLIRRILIPEMRYISLPADYFPLFLIIGIAASGILMRYFIRVDVTAAKELTMGLITFSPTVPDGIGVIFYIHLFLVCALLCYIPFSKLLHMGGVFFVPTRNLPNDSRAVRHINPWDYKVKVHSYEDYENEFRKKMVTAGLPVEKPVEKEAK